MKQENRSSFIKYAVCVGIELVIAFLVIWSKGFFILMTLFAGMLYVSSEGALVGIGFVLRNVVLTFIPMGRARQERYADYRERKMREMKKNNDICILITGLFFLAVGIVLTLIWYSNYYVI